MDDRKLNSNDIVNGIARRDIRDGKGMLLVKEGSRISEAHFQRMREEGMIQEKDPKRDKQFKGMDIHSFSPDSVHAKIVKLQAMFKVLQQKLVDSPSANLKEDLKRLTLMIATIASENLFQFMGELYLSEKNHYQFNKPLYIAVSLYGLMQRYNDYKPDEKIDSDKAQSLLCAALLHNIGMLRLGNQIKKTLNEEERSQLRAEYTEESLQTLKAIQLEDSTCYEAIKNHHVDGSSTGINGLLLRTPFIYAGLCMPENTQRGPVTLLNPCKEFTKLFASGKLHPELGGLFLKINGLIPIGANGQV